MDDIENLDCNCVEEEETGATGETLELDEAARHGIAVTCDCCCEKQQDVTFNPCEDIKDFTIENVRLKCEGRLLKVRVNLDRVCRGKKIILGILVCENIEGTFFIKGFRVCEIMVPGPANRCVDNVNVGDFCFIFPEQNLCCTRRFRVHVVAHYSTFPSFPFCPC